MNRIVQVFQKPRVLLPVVHAADEEQVREMVKRAFAADADGVLLINQGGMRAHPMLALAEQLVREMPERWIGVNLLGRPRDRALADVDGTGVHGLQVDDAGVTRDVDASAHRLRSFTERRELGTWRGLYFGGVAFKGQELIPKILLGHVARQAMTGVDVVTTSGPQTGSPPSVDHVARMRETIGDHALAVASGIDSSNVEAFLPLVDAFIVATGIESSFGILDPELMRELAGMIHGWTGGAA